MQTTEDRTEERVSDYESVLFARAMRLARSQSDAWDLVQDTYERALRGHTLGDPRRMLEYCAERIDELRRRHRIELGQSDHYSAFRANG